jgi:hypothetical protein
VLVRADVVSVVSIASTRGQVHYSYDVGGLEALLVTDFAAYFLTDTLFGNPLGMVSVNSCAEHVHALYAPHVDAREVRAFFNPSKPCVALLKPKVLVTTELKHDGIRATVTVQRD